MSNVVRNSIENYRKYGVSDKAIEAAVKAEEALAVQEAEKQAIEEAKQEQKGEKDSSKKKKKQETGRM